jgi:autotransporter adhesin
MNKVYKSVWNEALGVWVATSENCPSQGKGSGRLTRVALASAIALGATGSAHAGAVDGGSVESASGVAVGPGAKSQDTGTIAIGYGAYTDGVIGTMPPAGVISGTIAIGYNANSIGSGSIAFGQDAVVSSSAEVVDPIALGHAAKTSGQGSVSLGAASTASADSSVAIGNNSVSNRKNTVSVGNATTQRQLVQVANGTQSNDAVNVSQLQSVTALLGGGAALKTDGTVTAPAYSIKGTTYNTVGAALTALASIPEPTNKYFAANDAASSTDGASVTGAGSIAIGGNAVADNTGGSAAAISIGSDSRASAPASTVIGPGATATATNTVALGTLSIADRAGTVSVGSATNRRQIVNVANGTQSNDAVNVSQLQSVTALLGGGAALKSDGTVTAPTYSVAGATSNTVGDAIAKIDSTLAVKVAYDSSAKTQVTLGGAGAPDPVKLTNVMAATLSSTSTDAVNGSQLNTTNQNVSTLQTFANNINNGGGVKYFHTNSTLADSSATGTDAVAIGGAAKASAANSVALGSNSVADHADTVSVGSAGHERQITNVANGATTTDAVNFGQLSAVSADVSALSASAVKYDNKADGTPNYESVSLGGAGASKPTKLTNLKIADLSATSTDAVNGQQLFATNNRVTSLETFEGNIIDGGGIKYFHSNSTLADSSATGTDAVAIGGAANASAANSVALGSNSVADRANSVSVGSAGHERQITNVADGTSSTDAVNFGQLTTLSGSVDTLASFAVKYDAKDDGTPDYETVTLGGKGAAQPTLLTNLKAGDLSASSTDAVNGSQLYATNENVNKLQSFADNINKGGGITYFHSNSMLADSSATGADSVAIGGAAVASAKNAVALGANSVADRANSVSVGATGSERQVTNVAAGTAATDAVNVSQLDAVSSTVSALGASAIKYDTNADGTPDYANATLGNGNATGTALHNVAAGTSSMDAVNLGQFNNALAKVSDAADIAYNPLFSANGSRDTEMATSSGTHSVASGANAVASGTNAIASGAGSAASGNNAVAIGANASATANNSVAIGANSVADRANTVSVGSSSGNGQRQITNVAAGTDGSDAVNVNQMQQSVNTGVKSAKSYTDALRNDVNSSLSTANNHINSVGAMSSAMAMMAGSAAAVADKDNRFAAGTGVYRNKAAIAVGFQKRFGNNMVITVGGSTTGEESTGGAGFAFGF